jgi:hypothetical protein
LGQFCPSNPRLGGFQHRPTHGSFQTWGVPQNPIQLGKHMIIHWNVGYTGIPWYTSFSNKSTLPNPTLSSMALKLSARNCKKLWKIIRLHDDDRHHSYASTTCIINKYLASSICIYIIYIYMQCIHFYPSCELTFFHGHSTICHVPTECWYPQGSS